MLASGCSAQGISGVYIARDQDAVGMLQITQAQDGQLLGSLITTTLKGNGAITQDTINISGVADGHSLTLVAKSPIPLFPGFNLSGTIDGRTITLSASNGSERFTESSPDDYQAAVHQLRTEGAAIQQQRHIADVNAAVADLNKRLTDYAAMIQSPKNEQQIAAFHTAHAKTLERLRHGLEIEQKYPKGSFQAGQVAFAIGQIEFQLQAYDNPWDDVPARGRIHIEQFDTAIAHSLCRTNEDLTNCSQQPAAVRAYQAARPLVLRRCDDIEVTLKNDAASIKAIVAQANDYAR